MDDSRETVESLREEVESLRAENQALRETLGERLAAANRAVNDSSVWLYALEGSREGVWDWNAVTNEVFFSPRWKEILGYQEDELPNTLSTWSERVHPDDRERVFAELQKHLDGQTPYYETEHRLRCKDGSYRWVLDRGRVISWTEEGKPKRAIGTHADITLKKEAEMENQRLVRELSAALENVKKLSGLLPICARCKKIWDDRGYWCQIESYVRNHSDAEFSHGICPECAKEIYPEFCENCSQPAPDSDD